MNDRLRKIAIEADAWCDRYYFGDKFYDIEWEKKFAELIVRECANWIKATDSNSDIGEEDAQTLLEHFGVEP